MIDFFPQFHNSHCHTASGTFPVITGGQGMPVLFLHGFPQTHVIFHKIAPLLSDKITMVMSDLRGYGAAPKPPTDDRHSPYSKREMAADMIAVMDSLGHERFAIVGHDRGARVAHRLARDYPARVTHLSVLDIAPTLTMYEGTNKEFATAYYHWFFLIQNAPFPERLINHDPAFYLRAKFNAWSASEGWLDEDAFAHYLAAFSNPETVHASCEDYRAAAGIDLDHDKTDLGQKLQMPVQALWGKQGFVGKTYDVIATWQEVAEHVTGHAVSGGHFLPEEAPRETAEALLSFWGLQS